jgi:hypothetical protein
MGSRTASERSTSRKYAKATKNNFPGLLRVLGPNEKQGFVKSRGVFVPVGRAFPLQLPMVTIDPKIAGAAVDGVFDSNIP